MAASPELPHTGRTDEPGGCLAHGFAWLVISGILLIAMFLITGGCYLLYRLVN